MKRLLSLLLVLTLAAGIGNAQTPATPIPTATPSGWPVPADWTWTPRHDLAAAARRAVTRLREIHAEDADDLQGVSLDRIQHAVTSRGGEQGMSLQTYVAAAHAASTRVEARAYHIGRYHVLRVFLEELLQVFPDYLPVHRWIRDRLARREVASWRHGISTDWETGSQALERDYQELLRREEPVGPERWTRARDPALIRAAYRAREQLARAGMGPLRLAGIDAALGSRSHEEGLGLDGYVAVAQEGADRAFPDAASGAAGRALVLRAFALELLGLHPSHTAIHQDVKEVLERADAADTASRRASTLERGLRSLLARPVSVIRENSGLVPGWTSEFGFLGIP